MANARKRDYKTEKELWRMMFGPTKIAAIRREQADQNFREVFEDGHATSIREFLEPYAEDYRRMLRRRGLAWKHMTQFHPDAFPLLLKHGVDYEPYVFDDYMYREKIQPWAGKCFANSWFIVDNHARMKGPEDRSLTYVEGFLMGVLALPMLHAWNGLDGERPVAWDWSHYATTGWSRYFGIPFTKEEYDFIMQTAYGEPMIHSLFDRKNFERHRAPLLEVLSRRDNKEKPAA
ncbi:MAG: hypothetical protein V4681_01675 [Patescibacteria group bacterium]